MKILIEACTSRQGNFLVDSFYASYISYILSGCSLELVYIYIYRINHKYTIL